MGKLATAIVLLCLLALPAEARDMELTIYDDGLSCPGDCDAHVVINPADNGTRFAFAPASSRQNPTDCVNGSECRICLGEADDTCMSVIYRGGGPPAGTFDFTPAFYDATCGLDDIPTALRRQCDGLDSAVHDSGYDTRVNCFADPANARCDGIVEAARAKQEADTPERARCLEVGEAAYNASQPDAEKRRANACNYSDRRLGGPNSAGVRWRILLPGACRPDTYAGRDGLDCCSNNLRFVASVHPECTAFFPRPN